MDGIETSGAHALQQIRLKRAYDKPTRADGRRILVDAIWPRGVSKADLKIDDWMKQIAPSSSLRKWFGHDPVRWDGFVSSYRRELDDKPDVVAELLVRCRESRVTFVFAAADTRHNNAVALKRYLESAEA